MLVRFLVLFIWWQCRYIFFASKFVLWHAFAVCSFFGFHFFSFHSGAIGWVGGWDWKQSNKINQLHLLIRSGSVRDFHPLFLLPLAFFSSTLPLPNGSTGHREWFSKISLRQLILLYGTIGWVCGWDWKYGPGSW